ncbi:alpha/beta hydrolase [Simplicispira hankyongi]|uniref:Alpha/beta hydrolase n=1 Tax=Simplicispira hankyongi TaxID=2315688 RepID=A0A398CBW2_9BURK|nr:alpha/beta hydrolase [Simplicispira hankyongi]RID98418.1 alpha/beta hydrolase [Simplicispira hankyongi]
MNSLPKNRGVQCLAALLFTAIAGFVPAAHGGPLRERLQQRALQAQLWDDEADSSRSQPAPVLPAGTRVLRDLAYGPDRLQRMDVYLPAHAQAAPVLFLVHGGGWRRGDKTHGRLIDQKLAHWLPRGVVVVSINYRMLPQAAPDLQAQDVAQALAWAQQQAPGWGADAGRFVLMGHSAGAHLAALVAGDPQWLRAAGARAPQALVLLDSGALDVPEIMNERHARLFDQAFGSDPAYWLRVSPLQQLHAALPPTLLVCSSPRRDSCTQAQAYARKSQAQGGQAEVLPQPLSHGQINAQLGQAGAYTQAVDGFLSRFAAWAPR